MHRFTRLACIAGWLSFASIGAVNALRAQSSTIVGGTPPVLPLRLDLGATGQCVGSGFESMRPSKQYPAPPVAGGSYGYTSTTAVTAFAHEASGAPDCAWAPDKRVLSPLAPAGGTDAEYQQLLALCRDGHVYSSPTTFKYLPQFPGSFMVHVRLGHLDQAQDNQEVKVVVGGVAQLVTTETPATSLISGAWARTVVSKATFGAGADGPPLGGYRSYWFPVHSGGGPIELRFGANTRVQALEFWANAAAPAEFDVSTGELEVGDYVARSCSGAEDDADASKFANGLAKLNEGDAAAASATFGAISDCNRFLRATGRLWVVGWPSSGQVLDGNDGVEWTQLLLAIADLELVANPAGYEGAIHGRAAEYLDRAREYVRALKHATLRGYRLPHTFPDSSAPIVNPHAEDIALLSNLAAAEALWRDLSGERLADVLDNPVVDVHPLFFRAAHRREINLWSRNTRNLAAGTDAGDAFEAAQYKMWRELVTRGYVTPPMAAGGPDGAMQGDDGLAVGIHMATYVSPQDPQGGPLYAENNDPTITSGAWQHEGSPQVHGAAAQNWWTPLLAGVDALPQVTCGEWEVPQRRFQVALAAAQQWWVAQRMKQGIVDGAYVGELGGGSGDDPEFLLQFLYSILPLRGSLPEFTAALESLGKSQLEEQADHGYFFGDGTSAAADVEHTAEYTQNALLTGFYSNSGDPVFVSSALRSFEHVGDLATAVGTVDPVAWTATIGGGTHSFGGSPIARRYFKNWHFDAEGPDAAALPGDVPLNTRALLPLLHAIATTRNSSAIQIAREITEWWWSVCEDTSGPAGKLKPKGVVPERVMPKQPAGFTYEGAGGLEWWTGGYAQVTGGSTDAFAQCGAIYGLMLWRFLDTHDAGQKLDYLRPIYFAGQLAAEGYRVEHPNAAPCGTQALVTLGTATDPGTPRWTAQRLRESSSFLQSLFLALPVLEKNSAALDAMPDTGDATATLCWIRAMLIREAAAPGIARYQLNNNLQSLTASMQEGFTWLDAFFPLATEFTNYTDRAYLATDGPKVNIASMTSGGFVGYLPSHQLTIEPWLGQSPLNVAVLVAGWKTSPSGGKRLIAHVRNFEVDPNPADGVTDRDMRLRLWHSMEPVFRPGPYDVSIGVDSNQDGTFDGAVTTTSMTWFMPGSEFEFTLPYASSGVCPTAYTITIEPSSAPWSNPCTSVERHDVALVAQPAAWDATTKSLSVQLEGYNLGDGPSAPRLVYRTYVVYTASGWAVFTSPNLNMIPSIPGPTGLQVASAMTSATQSFANVNEAITRIDAYIHLGPPLGCPDMNSDNDVVLVTTGDL